MTIDKSFQEEAEICYTDDMAKLIETSSYTFEKLLELDRLYVDKTQFFYKLIKTQSAVFVSRPRRFGKSLAVSIFESIFQGRKELFDGLYISQTDYDWKKYPVIKFSFGSCSSKNSKDLNVWIIRKLNDIASNYGLEINTEYFLSEVFSQLIEKLYAKHGKVVILVDEYEKVITDNIYNENIEEMRDVLSSFYQVVKDMDEYIHFVFITGVTKYTKLSLFSKLNNLKDISMEYEYAEMFGYTQEELEHYFAEHIEDKMQELALDRNTLLSKLKDSYDGFLFSQNAESVYNPVSIGNFMGTKMAGFRNYWIDTGGRLTMLYDIADRCSFNIIKDLSEPLDEESFSQFDIIDIARGEVDATFLKCLMYQTGYLTIAKGVDDGSLLLLDFPNREVRRSYNVGFLEYETKVKSFRANGKSLLFYFENDDVERAMEKMKAMFAGIPSFVYTNAEKNVTEYFYQVLFYTILASAGMEIRMEEIAAHGRIDAVAESQKCIYILEFKRDKSAREALSQIRANHYADKFLSKGKKIKLIGINFSSKERNIDDYLVEEL